MDSLGVVLWRLAPDGTVRHVSDHLGLALPHLVLENPVGHHVCETLSMMDRQPFEHNVLYGYGLVRVVTRPTRPSPAALILGLTLGLDLKYI